MRIWCTLESLSRGPPYSPPPRPGDYHAGAVALLSRVITRSVPRRARAAARPARAGPAWAGDPAGVARLAHPQPAVRRGRGPRRRRPRAAAGPPLGGGGVRCGAGAALGSVALGGRCGAAGTVLARRSRGRTGPPDRGLSPSVAGPRGRPCRGGTAVA